MGKHYQFFYVINSIENPREYLLSPEDFEEQPNDGISFVLDQLPEFNPDPLVVDRLLKLSREL